VAAIMVAQMKNINAAFFFFDATLQ
jgi:hypothetical protein